VDGTNPEYTLYRASPWRALVESSGELRGCLFDPVFVYIRVEPHQADIFLVMLEKERCKAHSIAEHDKKQSGDLRVERSRMSYLAAEHPANPCSNLVA
jgi:hypothetical protein